MQSWRKGIKSTTSSSSASTKPDDKDTVIPFAADTKDLIKVSESHDSHSHDSDSEGVPDVGNKMAPKHFFTTCRKMSEFALELCTEDEKIAMAGSLVMMGLLGETPEEKDLVEMGEHMMTTFYEQFNESFTLILSKNDDFFDLDNPILQMLLEFWCFEKSISSIDCSNYHPQKKQQQQQPKLNLKLCNSHFLALVLLE
jgi:hypothetical protein